MMHVACAQERMSISMVGGSWSWNLIVAKDCSRLQMFEFETVGSSRLVFDYLDLPVISIDCYLHSRRSSS